MKNWYGWVNMINSNMETHAKLSADFYQHPEVTWLSRALLGKYLFTFKEGVLSGGMIVETEAYCGATDRACHAHLNKRTERTQVMFGPGGVAYVYLCYGIHALFNIVTNQPGCADAVLVRAIEPTYGIEAMQYRRNMAGGKVIPALTSGPGRLSAALGISTADYGSSLISQTIWIEDRGVEIPEDNIVATTRIGVEYAGPDALLPWRFLLKDNKWVSKYPGRRIKDL